MRKLIIFILLINSFCFGQVKSGWGPSLKNNVFLTKHMWISAEDSTNIYYIKRKYLFAKETWFIEAINKGTKTITFLKALIPPKGNNKKASTITNVICLGNKLYLLTTAIEGDEHTCYATAINKITGLKEKTKLVYSIKAPDDSKRIEFVISPDKQRILMYTSPYNTTKEEIKLMNGNFEEIWSDKIKLSRPDEEYAKFNAAIDNFGNIIIHSLTSQVVTVYSTKTNESKNIRIAMPVGMVNYTSSLGIAPNGDAYLLLLLKPEEYDITCGFIHSFINLNERKVLVTKTTLLDSIQIMEILGKNIGSKWEESGVYFTQNIFFRNNDLILIAEQRYKLIHYFFGFNNSFNSPINSSVLGYNHNDWSKKRSNIGVVEGARNLISVFSISFSGDINWVKIIPKNQFHPDENYLSYAANYNENGVYLIYNDNPENINRKFDLGPKKLEHPRFGVGVLAFINNGGQLKIDFLERKMPHNSLILKPGLSFNGSNSIFMFSEKKSFFSLGELILD